MVLKLKKGLILSLVAIALLIPGVAVAAEDPPANPAKDAVCNGINVASGASGSSCKGDEANKSVNNLIADIINIFSWVVGVVAVITIIFGGFQFVVAAGDAAKIAKARTLILYAIVGLVVVVMAQVIVQFVLGEIITKK